MLITYWYGPPKNFTNKDTYADVFDAGFTVAGPMGCTGVSFEENKLFLDACFKNNLKACIYDIRMDKAIESYTSGKDNWEDYLTCMVEDYKFHPALSSYYIFDEPGVPLFTMLKDIFAKLKELDPNHPGYINLLPNYATFEQLGCNSYYEYIKSFIEQVKPAFLSYDHYHFLHFKPNELPNGFEIEETDDERENAIRHSAMINIERPGFFENIDIVRQLSLEYNLPFMVIVLLIEHGPYRNLKESELRFEAFQSLAYGAKMLSFFTYWTVIEPGSWWNWQNACISCEGEKLDHYYDVMKINKELHIYFEYLKNKKSLNVIHYDLNKISLTIGYFSDGFIVVANKDFDNYITFDFNNVFDYDINNVTKLDLDNNSFMPIENKNISIAPGDMILLKI